MLIINGIDEVKARVGEELGVTDWHAVTQEDIDAFADVTGDHQFIHVDVDAPRKPPSAGRSPTATTRCRWPRALPMSRSHSKGSPSRSTTG